MESLRELYRTGRGPSSSHTMGPSFAAAEFLRRTPGAARYEVTLCDSLASTGRGHFTDRAIKDVLGAKRTKILWKPDEQDGVHPNGMRFAAFDADGAAMAEWKVYSVGGGAIYSPPCGAGRTRAAAGKDGKKTSFARPRCIYKQKNFSDFVEEATRGGVPIWQIVEDAEGSGIWGFLAESWRTMDAAIERGLAADGVLPGGLRLPRKARSLYIKAKMQSGGMRRTGLLAAYAHAVAEENASLGVIVTAPTCGSCGVLPAVLRYMREELPCSETEILRALATAGAVGNVVKRNGSISGAEVGCQGEVGVACAMASAAASYLLGGSPRQCECAAEIGLEHFLGLTCDPVKGLVQIPCIERNALAATRAVVAGEMSVLTDGSHVVSFDTVVKTMLATGHDLPRLYRETAVGGLSRFVRR
ncbi:MAG: L-serine ammonia-lyase, iron-sulfur-dependent, subunit alpha [Kiritimatiellae bacterium]|nr:L-serine ammonia-lyase, iron-sulfur-dependent, subunit alpha [Kiritimatiellia bacterium]